MEIRFAFYDSAYINTDHRILVPIIFTFLKKVRKLLKNKDKKIENKLLFGVFAPSRNLILC